MLEPVHWADRTLIGSGWYPPEVKSPEDRLRYYSERFPIAQADSTYYRGDERDPFSSAPTPSATTPEDDEPAPSGSPGRTPTPIG